MIKRTTYRVTEAIKAALADWFSYHPAVQDQPLRYEQIRREARDLATTIMGQVPDSEERRQSLTRLREAVMWANAAIACNERYPQDEPTLDEAGMKALAKRYHVGKRVKIKKGYANEGRQGKVIAPPVYVEQPWAAVLWDDEDDPDWCKVAGLVLV